MYSLKGFYLYPSLIDNATDKVAKFGELSDDSLTYAKNKTYHGNAANPDVHFAAFHSVRDEIAVGVGAEYVEQVVKLGQFLFTQANSGSITGTPAQCVQLITAEFGSVMNTVSVGQILNDGVRNMPEWVEFSLTSSGETNRINVWLADASFSASYDEYTVEIIHPVIPYDDFFKDPLEVRELLRSYNLVEKLAEVQERRKQYPYTFQQAFQFNYTNPRDTTFTEPATWIAVIYGQAGNNPDLIKDAIIKDLLSATTREREDWEAILPDLFMTTEFIITPFWHQYSVPKRDLFAGVYSPTTDPRKLLPLLRLTAQGTGYTATWVNSAYELSAHIYKSIAFGIVGNPKNRGGVTQFSKQFSDYMIVTNSAAEANSMDPITREWVAKFASALVTAESMDRYSAVPTGMARMIRNNVIYTSFYHKNINYMIATKGSVLDLV